MAKPTTAPTRTTISSLMEKARSTSATKWLLVAGIGLAFIPVVGSALSYWTGKRRNAIIRDNQQEVLAKVYKKEIAARVGKSDPDSVNSNDLLLAAEADPSFKKLTAKVDAEHKSANRSELIASTAAGALSLIPGMGSVTKGVAAAVGQTGANIVVHGGAILGGDVLSRKLFDRPILYTQDVVEVIDAKMAEGTAVTPTDVVLLRIAQDELWQKNFKKQYGKPFHQLNDVEKQQVAASMPEMLLKADVEAEALSKGLISVQQLVMGGPSSTSNFTGAIGRKPEQKSFVAAEAQRAAGRNAAVTQL